MTAAGEASAVALLSALELKEPQAWEPFREGVEVCWLYRAQPDGYPASALLRYQPGAGVPLHSHPGHEFILVLAGAQEDARGRYAAGSFVVNAPGTRHEVRSPEGCVVLITWEEPVQFEG